MRKKHLCVLLFSIILTTVLLGSSQASTRGRGYPGLELAKPLIGPDSQLPQATLAIPYSAPAEPKTSPLGQTYLLGTTWYDYQHNGTISKMVALSPNWGVHFCWMNGLQAQAVDRHIYYNYWDPAAGALNWPDVGYQVDQANRGGYTCLDQLSGGEVVIAMHTNPIATDPWTATVAYDFLEGFGAFQSTVLWPPPGYENLAWPHGTVDNQDNIHVVAHENRTDVWQRITYARSEDGGASYTDWVVVDTIVSISGDIAASPVSDKVGVAYTKSAFDPLHLGPYDGLLVSQLNNNIALVESQDGVTWDFLDRRLITDFVEPDSNHYPDSTWANGDTLRCYCDVSLLYDQNDYAHVAFTTRYLGFDAGLAAHPDSFAITGMSLDASMIWHWSEEHDTLTVIADGWYDVGAPTQEANAYRGSGAWRSTCDRPSLAQDPTTGYLYCSYVRCVEGDTSGGSTVSHGFANGEIYCSVSTDGGLNWSEGTNLTQTPSPLATPGNCMDEDYASLAQTVNDTLHLIWVEDKDAGGVVQTAPQEGGWTENPVKYQKVPASLVPPGPPFVPNYNFHVGPTTGVQEPTLVNAQLPTRYTLSQNYPNPFNPETTINFDIPHSGAVSLNIYNISGQLVRELTSGHRQAGSYQIRWNGRNDQGHLVPSGIYFCQMKTAEFSATTKMALIK